VEHLDILKVSLRPFCRLLYLRIGKPAVEQ